MADKDEQDAAQPKKKRLWLWLGIAGLIVAGGAGGGYVFLTGGSKTSHKPAPPPPVRFISLQPFVSNLSGGSLHYIQVTVKLKTRVPKAQAEVNNRLPEIRDAVLNILAEQHVSDVVGAHGRTMLRAEILQAVNRVLNSRKDSSGLPASGSGAASAASAPEPVSARNPASIMGAARAEGPILGVYFTAFVVQ